MNFKCWRFSSKGLVKVFRLCFRRNAVLMISSWLKQRRIGNLDLQKLNQSCFGEENRQWSTNYNYSQPSNHQMHPLWYNIQRQRQRQILQYKYKYYNTNTNNTTATSHQITKCIPCDIDLLLTLFDDDHNKWDTDDDDVDD